MNKKIILNQTEMWLCHLREFKEFFKENIRSFSNERTVQLNNRFKWNFDKGVMKFSCSII